ncbi:hypothetical protein SAMN00808754_1469 [Thermanaeromonas toyohensis ToBE]|uniref:Uncharacterized protein n=1 Tax=Thermanaeromonas toyohensis ToBE TaxID=698762 RepID=A0A1W1VSM1_9FIRM|nr:hypothetical protein [Thermanaeromonas toyohensis]SMB96372.1 hypothetical protein SAMN00808754_1469 [Thermanaeromonas toyohensis ToBE]
MPAHAAVLDVLGQQIKQRGVVLSGDLGLEGLFVREALRRHFGLQYLPVEENATGKIIFGRVNVGINDEDYRGPVTVLPDGTIIISASLGRKGVLEVLRDDLGVYVPQQAVEAVKTPAEQVNVLDYRNTFNLVGYLTPEQLWDLAECGLLGKSLTDAEIAAFGLREAVEKRKADLDSAAVRLKAGRVPGTGVTVVEEPIPDGERVAFALGYDYFVRVNSYAPFSLLGFEVIARPGKRIPGRLISWAKGLENVERAGFYVDPDGRRLWVGEAPHLGSGVRLSPEDVRKAVAQAMIEEQKVRTVDGLLARFEKPGVSEEASGNVVKREALFRLRPPRLGLKL